MKPDMLDVFRAMNGAADFAALHMESGSDGRLVAETIAAAVGLVADLIQAGQNPVVAITEIRSSLPDFDAAMARVRARLAAKFPKDGE